MHGEERLTHHRTRGCGIAPEAWHPLARKGSGSMALMGLVHPVACVKEGRGDTETDTPPVRFFVASLTTGGTHVPRRVGTGKATWPSTKEENPMTRRWLMKVSTHASRAAHGGLHLAVLLGLAVAFFFLLGTTPARAGSTALTTCGQVLGAAGEY